MPFPPAAPAKVPTAIGLVTLKNLSTNAKGEPVAGTVVVQVLDQFGAEYSKGESDIATTLANLVKTQVQQAIDAVRTQAENQIL